jgi:hypothetical protein
MRRKFNIRMKLIRVIKEIRNRNPITRVKSVMTAGKINVSF